MLTNENNWTLPELTPKPTPKKRGVLFLSPEDMQEAKKSMKEKGIKGEDVKNLPPIEEIHGLNLPHVCRGFLAPRAPMGTEPLLGSAGGGGRAKSGSRRSTQGFFTQLRSSPER